MYDGTDIVLVYNASGSLVTRYLAGPGIDQILAAENATSEVVWFLADSLGTVRDVARFDPATNTTSVVNHLAYDAFGKITSQSDPGRQPLFAFTGREWDPDAELYHYRARWYDPKAGRFLSEDPLGFAAGDVNLARYVGNAPTLYVDPSGMEKLTKEMLTKAREEMEAARLTEEQIRFVLILLENINKGKVYCPDPRDDNLPDFRNPKYWELVSTPDMTGDYYIPRGLPSEAINDLWNPESRNGIFCQKYSKLALIKTWFDLANSKQRAELNAALAGKEIPNQLEDQIIRRLYRPLSPKTGEVFNPSELLPGDQIWFNNPYFKMLEYQRVYQGENGSNVIYIGNGMVMQIYDGHEVYTIADYQRKMESWRTVMDWNESNPDRPAKPEDFQIEAAVRPVAP